MELVFLGHMGCRLMFPDWGDMKLAEVFCEEKWCLQRHLAC